MCIRDRGRLVGRGPTLIEALVGIAIDSVAHRAAIQFIGNTKPAADQVRQYLQDLDSLPPLPEMAEKIDRCERMMFLDAAQQLARGGRLSGLTGNGQNPFDQVIRTLSTGAIDWNVPMRMANQWYDRISDAMREENHFTKRQKMAQLEEELQEISAEARKPWSMAGSMLLNPRKTMGRVMGQVLISLMLPAVSAAEAATDRADQSFSNLRVALALAAYRSDVGKYPPQLAELVPKYLPEMPPDIFTQDPLRYRAEGAGYLLYSIGENGKDDEGRWRDDNPPGDDLHVRMPPVVRPR
jgi:hypothetical protein